MTSFKLCKSFFCDDPETFYTVNVVMIHPSFDHEKEYVVETANQISDKSLECFRHGVTKQDSK